MGESAIFRAPAISVLTRDSTFICFSVAMVLRVSTRLLPTMLRATSTNMTVPPINRKAKMPAEKSRTFVLMLIFILFFLWRKFSTELRFFEVSYGLLRSYIPPYSSPYCPISSSV